MKMIDIKTSTIVNDVITPHYVCGANGQPVNLDHGERFAITKLVEGDYKHVHRKNGDVKCVQCRSASR